MGIRYENLFPVLLTAIVFLSGCGMGTPASISVSTPGIVPSGVSTPAAPVGTITTPVSAPVPGISTSLATPSSIATASLLATPDLTASWKIFRQAQGEFAIAYPDSCLIFEQAIEHVAFRCTGALLSVTLEQARWSAFGSGIPRALFDRLTEAAIATKTKYTKLDEEFINDGFRQGYTIRGSTSNASGNGSSTSDTYLQSYDDRILFIHFAELRGIFSEQGLETIAAIIKSAR